MRHQVVVSLAVMGLLGSCTAPPMVQYEVVEAPAPASTEAIDEEALQQAEAEAVEADSEAAEDMEETAEDAVDPAILAQEKQDRKFLEAALSGGKNGQAAPGKIFFHLPRSLLFLSLEKKSEQGVGGTEITDKLAAYSLPTEAPVRHRVYEDMEALENGLEGEETLFDVQGTEGGNPTEDQPATTEEPTPLDSRASGAYIAEQPQSGSGMGTASGVGSESMAFNGSGMAPEMANAEMTAKGDMAVGDENAEEDMVDYRPFHYEETRPPLYMMKVTAGQSLGGAEDLQVSYFENTRLIAAIGRDVNEAAPSPTQQGSTNLIALANTSPIYFSSMPEGPGAAMGGGPQLPAVLPTAIDVQFYLEELRQDNEWQDLPFNPGWSYRIDIGDPPADSVNRELFFNETAGTSVNVLPVSACRDATLYIVQEEPKNLVEKKDIAVDYSQYIEEQSFHQFTLKVADPTRVQLVSLPTEGQVTMHSSCGADVREQDYRGVDVRADIAGKAMQARGLMNSWQTVLRR